MLLHHEVAGSGPPVVLIHSGVCDMRMWDPQWPALTAQNTVVRLDLRGYGKSPLPAGGADGRRADPAAAGDGDNHNGASAKGNENASGGEGGTAGSGGHGGSGSSAGSAGSGGEAYSDAEDVRALLEELGITGASMVGASAGGRVALQVASAWPELVSRLALLCPLYDLPPTSQLRRFGRREGALLDAGDIEGATELNVATWLGPEAEQDAVESVREMQRHAFEVQLAAGEDVRQAPGPPIDLAALDMPVMVVSGAHDLDFFRDVAEHLADRIPQTRHIALSWAWHLPSLQRPETVTELMRAFL